MSRARGARWVGCVLTLLVLASCTGEDEPEPKKDLLGLEPLFGADVRTRAEGAFGLERWREVGVSEPDLPQRAVRVPYPAGSVSPSATREYGAPGGGLQVFLPAVDGPQDAAYLRYWVYFPPDFDFVKGGKLPGMWGGSQVSGGEEPDGTDGFSTRLMWRKDGDGEVYLYAPGESGTSLGRGDWTWPTGQWTCVEEHVVLNDPDNDDGEVTVWLDGEEVYSKTDLLYRTVDSLKIEGIFFSTFFGGADPSWAPSEDQYADFTGFELSDARIGCEP